MDDRLINGPTATPDLNPTKCRWLVEWKDSDPYRRIWESADSVEQTREVIERLLAGETWTPEDAEELGGKDTEPAYDALVREEFDGDIKAGIIQLRFERFSFECDNGKLTIERER